MKGRKAAWTMPDFITSTSNEKPADISLLNYKLDVIMENQAMILNMFTAMGQMMVEFSSNPHSPKLKKREHIQTADSNTVSEPQAEGTIHVEKDIFSQIREKYGVSCTQPEAAKILGLSVRTVARMLNSGKIQRLGHRVNVDSVVEYLHYLKETE